MLVIRPMVPRTGREHQRYAGNVRLVAGCIPITKDGKVVMISRWNKKDGWTLPKGGWEDDETLEQSATREAYEEAGVIGVLGSALQDIDFRNKRGDRDCRMSLFILHVTDLAERWPESHERKRKLVTVEEAMKECRRPEMREALKEMTDRGLHLVKPPTKAQNTNKKDATNRAKPQA